MGETSASLVSHNAENHCAHREFANEKQPDDRPRVPPTVGTGRWTGVLFAPTSALLEPGLTLVGREVAGGLPAIPVGAGVRFLPQ